MAVYTILLCVGPLVGGIAGGYIAFGHGWVDLFWVSTGLSAFCFVGTLLIVSEPLFARYIVSESSSQLSSNSKGADATQMEQQPLAMTYKPYNFTATLGFGKTRRTLLHHFKKPWRSLDLPGTWVVMLHYAGVVGGIVTMTTVSPQILAMPPYLWKENVGLINLSGIIGAALGYAYAFVLSDWLLKRRAKSVRNGVAEAEDRLPNPWFGLGAAFAIVAFGLMQIPSVGFNYLIDSYGALAADAFTMVTILRSIISFV
ncbi:uncharacterized protein J7T54_005660 [Emericellopsis cladophorae]|uniref:Major facilitator superfamily (MFS) profile domain-containing protein n=1 Tax=Emericellopsis cladophorae TaxID=2686198 RepID=A0A9P9Y569_9HYPO|nr:uncharacterized protein J7T54_005660 [Emericellopsis cladophorae]KAI6783631.1 hypothetical protein J7T54_005660 [Emericellopsis cladophorae]